jgi:pilus assembly protein CpaC
MKILSESVLSSAARHVGLCAILMLALSARADTTEPAAAVASAPVTAPSAPAPEQTAAPTRITAVPDALQVMAGASRMITMPARIESVVVAQPNIADAKPVSPRDVVIIGKTVGSSDMVIHLESGESITQRVRVELDKADMEARIERIFGVKVQVDDLGGTVALRGTMPDVATAGLIHKYMDSTGMKWTDLTKIEGLQQVQLRVRIAEASRTALRELAFGGVVGGNSAFGGFQPPGGTPFQSVSIAPMNPQTVSANGSTTVTQNVVGPGQPNFGFSGTPVSSATTLFVGVPGADLEIFMRALTENRYVRLLAEPNLVAISGEKASFLVGGEFPVPVVQGNSVGGGAATVTVEYKPFGVRLTFRPEVLGEGRIRLEVAPEVSELSEVGALVQNGFTVPGVSVRRSSSTVELGNGQSFAMAGLLRSKDQGKVAKVPLLGDLPWLGVLFRSVRYEQDETELVVIVTATTVEPLNDGMDRPTPGALHQAPNDWELFMEGRLAGANDVVSPVARLRTFGLTDLRGPGAWRRPEDTRVAAADAMPSTDATASDAQPAPAEAGASK